MTDAASLEKRAKRSSRGFLSFIFGHSAEDEPQELYAQAANLYKQQHKWDDATRCFLEAAKASQQAKEHYSAAANYLEAASSLLKSNKYTKDHLVYIENAVEIYAKQGRFSQGARALKGVAEHFEQLNEHDVAAKYYKLAAQQYELDDLSKVAHSQCLLKYADNECLHAQQLLEPLKVYEKLALQYLGNSLLQYGAKEIFLKAALIHIIEGDATDANIAMGRFSAADSKFKDSRQGRLLQDIIDAFEAQDGEGFMHVVREYDSISKLDPVMVALLKKIQQALPSENINGNVAANNITGDGDGDKAKDTQHVDLT